MQGTKVYDVFFSSLVVVTLFLRYEISPSVLSLVRFFLSTVDIPIFRSVGPFFSRCLLEGERGWGWSIPFCMCMIWSGVVFAFLPRFCFFLYFLPVSS